MGSLTVGRRETGRKQTDIICRCYGQMWVVTVVGQGLDGQEHEESFYRCARCGDETYSVPLMGGYRRKWLGTVKLHRNFWGPKPYWDGDMVRRYPPGSVGEDRDRHKRNGWDD